MYVTRCLVKQASASVLCITLNDLVCLEGGRLKSLYNSGPAKTAF